MNRFAVTLGLIAALWGANARAQAISVAVGETKTLTLARKVTGISVENPGIVEAKTLSSRAGVSLVGRDSGKTEIRFTTADGARFGLTVYVVHGHLDLALTFDPQTGRSRGESLRLFPRAEASEESKDEAAESDGQVAEKPQSPAFVGAGR